MTGVLTVIAIGLVVLGLVGLVSLVPERRAMRARQLRKENASLRQGLERVQSLALDHVETDPFAVIVLDETRTCLKEINR